MPRPCATIRWFPSGALCLVVAATISCTGSDESSPADHPPPLPIPPTLPSPSPEPTGPDTADSTAFTTVRGETDLIRLESPAPGEVITSPLTVRGRARGGWYFEADFPVTLTDWDGRIIAEHYATAQGDWMTSDFVPFESVIEFDAPEDIGDFSRRGSLILRRNNASGLPEHDDAIEITVFFWPER